MAARRRFAPGIHRRTTPDRDRDRHDSTVGERGRGRGHCDRSSSSSNLLQRLAAWSARYRPDAGTPVHPPSWIARRLPEHRVFAPHSTARDSCEPSNSAPDMRRFITPSSESIARGNRARWTGVDGEPGFDGMAALSVQNPDGHFIGWAPGRGPITSPDGMPWRLDPGSDLVIELHLLHVKQPVDVQPSVGVYFTDKPRHGSPVMVVMGTKAIDIPAGDRKYSDYRRLRASGRREAAECLSARALSGKGDDACERRCPMDAR